MAGGAPGQAETAGGNSYGQNMPKSPPPDLPSLLLDARIVYGDAAGAVGDGAADR